MIYQPISQAHTFNDLVGIIMTQLEVMAHKINEETYIMVRDYNMIMWELYLAHKYNLR